MGVQNEANRFVKISAGLWLNRKWRALCASDPAAATLWVSALSFSGMTLADGVISADAVAMMGGTVDQVEAIIRSGLGVGAGDGGFIIHDYAKYQRTSDQVLAVRKVRAEAGRKGGLSKARNRMSQSEIRRVDSEKIDPETGAVREEIS